MTDQVKITRMSARGYAEAFLKTKSAKARKEIISACEDHVANGGSRKIANTLAAMRDGNTASLKCRVSGDWSKYKRPAKPKAAEDKADAKAAVAAVKRHQKAKDVVRENDPVKALAEKLAGDEEMLVAFFNMVTEARK